MVWRKIEPTGLHGALLVAVWGLSGCASGKLLERSDAGPVRSMSNASSRLEVEGVWHSKGHGWIVEVIDGEARRHEYGAFGCYPTPHATRGVTDMLSLPFRYYRLGPGEDWAIFQYLTDDAGPVFERISGLPEACEAPREPTPAYTFEVFSEIFRAHYAFFDLRRIDWEQRVQRAQAKLPDADTDEELFSLFETMLEGLSDSHTKLLATIDGEPRRVQDGLGPTLTRMRAEGESSWLIALIEQTLTDTLDPGARHVANERIIWGTLDGRIGYVQIFVMGGFSGIEIGDPRFREAELSAFDSIMDEALSAFEGLDAVIVDLSNNRGGYDAIARRIASRFTSKRFMGYRTSIPGSGVAPLERWIDPAPGPRFTGPVYLLTSDVTVSGGEIATLCLRQLPNVTQVGQTTRGSFSTPLAKALPNGWVVELSNEIFSAPDGTIYEEVGLEPQWSLEFYPAAAPVEGHARAIEELVDRIPPRGETAHE